MLTPLPVLLNCHRRLTSVSSASNLLSHCLCSFCSLPPPPPHTRHLARRCVSRRGCARSARCTARWAPWACSTSSLESTPAASSSASAGATSTQAAPGPPTSASCSATTSSSRRARAADDAPDAALGACCVLSLLRSGTASPSRRAQRSRASRSCAREAKRRTRRHLRPHAHNPSA